MSDDLLEECATVIRLYRQLPLPAQTLPMDRRYRLELQARAEWVGERLRQAMVVRPVATNPATKPTLGELDKKHPC